MVSPEKPAKPDSEKCHRVWEKARRDKLRVLFEELSRLVPKFDPVNPLSRPELLKKVIEYIRELQAQNEDLLNGGFDEIYRNKLEALKRRVKELLSRVDQLSSILRTANIQLPPLVVEGGTPPSWTVSRPKHWTDKIKLPEGKVEEVIKQLGSKKQPTKIKPLKRKKKAVDVSTVKENQPVSKKPLRPKTGTVQGPDSSKPQQIPQIPSVVPTSSIGQPNTFLLTTQGNLLPVITPTAGVLTPVFINKPPVLVLQPPQPPPVPKPVVIVPSNKKRIPRDSTVTTFSNKRPISALSKQSHTKKDGKCQAHKHSSAVLQPSQLINAPAVSPTAAFLNSFPVVASSGVTEVDKPAVPNAGEVLSETHGVTDAQKPCDVSLNNGKCIETLNEENTIVVATLKTSSLVESEKTLTTFTSGGKHMMAVVSSKNSTSLGETKGEVTLEKVGDKDPNSEIDKIQINQGGKPIDESVSKSVTNSLPVTESNALHVRLGSAKAPVISPQVQMNLPQEAVKSINASTDLTKVSSNPTQVETNMPQDKTTTLLSATRSVNVATDLVNVATSSPQTVLNSVQVPAGLPQVATSSPLNVFSSSQVSSSLTQTSTNVGIVPFQALPFESTTTTLPQIATSQSAADSVQGRASLAPLQFDTAPASFAKSSPQVTSSSAQISNLPGGTSLALPAASYSQVITSLASKVGSANNVEVSSAQRESSAVPISTKPFPIESSLPRLATSCSSCQVVKSSMQGTTPSLQVATSSIQGTTPSLQVATSSIQGTTPSLQVAGNSIRGTTPSLQVAGNSIQGTTPSLQVATSSMQGTTPSLHVATSSMQGTTPSPQVATSSMLGTTPSLQVAGNSIQGTTPSLQVAGNSIQGTAPSLQVVSSSMQGTTPSLQVATSSMQCTTPSLLVATSLTPSQQVVRTSLEVSSTPFPTRVGSMVSISQSDAKVEPTANSATHVVPSVGKSVPNVNTTFSSCEILTNSPMKISHHLPNTPVISHKPPGQVFGGSSQNSLPLPSWEYKYNALHIDQNRPSKSTSQFNIDQNILMSTPPKSVPHSFDVDYNSLLSTPPKSISLSLNPTKSMSYSHNIDPSYYTPIPGKSISYSLKMDSNVVTSAPSKSNILSIDSSKSISHMISAEPLKSASHSMNVGSSKSSSYSLKFDPQAISHSVSIDQSKSINESLNIDSLKSQSLNINAKSASHSLTIDQSKSISHPPNSDSKPVAPNMDLTKSISQPLNIDLPKSICPPLNMGSSKSISHSLNVDSSKSVTHSLNMGSSKSISYSMNVDSSKSVSHPTSETAATLTYTTLMPPVTNTFHTQSSWLPLPSIYSNDKYNKPNTTTWRPIPPEPVWSSGSISESWTDYNSSSSIITFPSTTAVYTSAGFYYRNTASTVSLCDTTWSTGISKAPTSSSNKFSYSEGIDSNFTYKASALDQSNPWHQSYQPILPGKNDNYEFNLPKPTSSMPTSSYSSNFYSHPSSTTYSTTSIDQSLVKSGEPIKIAENPFNHSNSIIKTDKQYSGNYINPLEPPFSTTKPFTLDVPKTFDPSYSLSNAKSSFINSATSTSSSIFTPSIYSELSNAKSVETAPYSVSFTSSSSGSSAPKISNVPKELSRNICPVSAPKTVPTSSYGRLDVSEQRGNNSQKSSVCDNSLWSSSYIPQPSCVGSDIGLTWNQTDFLAVSDKDPKLRPPINWMTEPDHRTDGLNPLEDPFPPRYQVPPNILDYCLTSNVEDDGNKNKNRKKDDVLSQDYFNWMSMKCDPMVVPSTLPTLVGDLALGDPPPMKKPKTGPESQDKPESFANLSKNIFDVTQNDQKPSSETIVLKNIFELPTVSCNKQQKQNQNQNTFLSVSQLVEPHLDTGQQKSDYTYYNQRNGKGKRTSGWKCGEKKCQQNLKSCTTNYSTEALLRSNQVEPDFTLPTASPTIFGRDYQQESTENMGSSVGKSKNYTKTKKQEYWRQDCKANSSTYVPSPMVKKNSSEVSFPTPEESQPSSITGNAAMFSYPGFPTNPPGSLLPAPNFPQPLPEPPPIFPQSPARCLPTDTNYTVRYPARKPQTYSRNNKPYSYTVDNTRKTGAKSVSYSKNSVNHNVPTVYGKNVHQTPSLSAVNFLPNTHSPNPSIIHYSKPAQVQQIPHPIMSSVTTQCPPKIVSKPENTVVDPEIRPVTGSNLPLPYSSFPSLPPQTPGSSGSSLANFNLSTIFPEINKKGYNQYS